VLRVGVLLQHPQVHRIASRLVRDRLRDAGHQLRAYPGTALAVVNMQIVDKAAPPRVVVEHDVDESDQPAVVLREDRGGAGRAGEPLRPDLATVGVDVPVQERVRVRTPVVPTPTVGVQGRNLLRVVCVGRAEFQWHANLLRGLPGTRAPSLVLTRGTPPTRRVAGQQAGATR